MARRGWTREKPKEAGWYWWRDVDKHGKVRFCVCQEVYLLHGSLFAADCGYLDKLDGEWLGPITPDSYQQGRVEGLREAAIICRERGKPHDIQWWMTASKKEVSAQTAIDCAELIEQAAQEGKGVGDGQQ